MPVVEWGIEALKRCLQVFKMIKNLNNLLIHKLQSSKKLISHHQIQVKSASLPRFAGLRSQKQKKWGVGREVRVYVNLETAGGFQVVIARCKSIKKLYE